MHFTKYDKGRNCQACEFRDRIYIEIASVVPLLELTSGKLDGCLAQKAKVGGGKITEEGGKNSSKMSKKRSLMVQWHDFSREEISGGKIAENFQGVIFLW